MAAKRLGVNNGDVLRDAAIAGLGLVALPTFIVSEAIQRGKLKPCRALRGKLLVPRTELVKLLKTE